MRLHADDPEPLLTLQRLLGGIIYGPYEHNGRRYRDWRLRGRPLYAQLHLFDAILPPGRKRDQYFAWKVKDRSGKATDALKAAQSAEDRSHRELPPASAPSLDYVDPAPSSLQPA